MKYYPEKTIEENAALNGVKVPSVRKYLRLRKIDRRYDKKIQRMKRIKELADQHLSARTIAKKLDLSPSTICAYLKLLRQASATGQEEGNLGLAVADGKTSMLELRESLRFDSQTPIDFMKRERYVGSLMDLVAFSKGEFVYNGYSIGFGNMKTWPILFMGEPFSCTETAYIACNYGKNDTECIKIQKAIQAMTNGLKCKRVYRKNDLDRRYGREDFHQSEWHFNLMLYLVWEKCKQHPAFREMLLATPDDCALIENQNSFAKVKEGDWGCKNAVAQEAYRKEVKRLMAAEVKAGKKVGESVPIRIKQQATIKTWNQGVWEGCNHQGKILMACRSALRMGTEPCIRYDLLNEAEIYLFGHKLHFEPTGPVVMEKPEDFNFKVVSKSGQEKSVPTSQKRKEGRNATKENELFGISR